MTPQEFTAKYLDGFLDRLSIPKEWVFPLFAIVVGYRVAATDNRGGGWSLGRIWFGRATDEALFYNGIMTFRFMLPFFFGLSIRWAGSNPAKREFLQCYLPGWKLNGKFSAVFRIQSDNSAAAGFTSPNPNQAQGWMDGPK